MDLTDQVRLLWDQRWPCRLYLFTRTDNGEEEEEEVEEEDLRRLADLLLLSLTLMGKLVLRGRVAISYLIFCLVWIFWVW